MALPRGIRNNNPLNIRKGNNWKGERSTQIDKSFEEFVSLEYGIRAAFIILRNYITGYHGRTQRYDTVEKIINRWAPPLENATKAYIRHVADTMKVDPTQKIHFEDRTMMISLAMAMTQVECGQVPDRSYYESAYDLV